jgi:hypothetical protein
MNAEARRAWAEHFAERIETELERDDWQTTLTLLEAVVGEPAAPWPRHGTATRIAGDASG